MLPNTLSGEPWYIRHAQVCFAYVPEACSGQCLCCSSWEASEMRKKMLRRQLELQLQSCGREVSFHIRTSPTQFHAAPCWLSCTSCRCVQSTCYVVDPLFSEHSQTWPTYFSNSGSIHALAEHSPAYHSCSSAQASTHMSASPAASPSHDFHLGLTRIKGPCTWNRRTLLTGGDDFAAWGMPSNVILYPVTPIRLT